VRGQSTPTSHLAVIHTPHFSHPCGADEDAGNYFFTGVGVESARVASEVFGYDVLLTRSLKHSADTGSIDLTQLSAAINAVVEAKPDVLLLSLRQREWDHALKQLSTARPESLRGVATPIAGGHTFMGVWFQGASQQANGVDCMGSGDACSYVTGGTQMSKDESLNAYKDGLLDKTYSWLRTESGYMVGFDNSSLVSFPDGAMIPSFLAQALQQVFRFRPLTNRERPLADATDYELFRSFLASGEKVADTFYGPCVSTSSARTVDASRQHCRFRLTA